MAGTGLAWPQQAVMAIEGHRDGFKACSLLRDISRKTAREIICLQGTRKNFGAEETSQ